MASINDPIRLIVPLPECNVCGFRGHNHTADDCNYRIRRAEWRSDQREAARDAVSEAGANEFTFAPDDRA